MENKRTFNGRALMKLTICTVCFKTDSKDFLWCERLTVNHTVCPLG